MYKAEIVISEIISESMIESRTLDMCFISTGTDKLIYESLVRDCF